MSPAVASLLALVFAIVLSMTSRLNVGLVSLALAWIVGVYVSHLSADVVIRGFPSSLFLTLAGMTLLFASAEANGTLAGLAERAVRLARGHTRVLPLMFFVIACGISAVGPGAVSSTALIAPLAMAIGARAGVPAFLTALMVANGANAGNLSPLSAVGVIANTKMAAAGLGGHEGKVLVANLVASTLVAIVAYVALGGHRLASTGRSTALPAARAGHAGGGRAPWLSGYQQLTALILLVWIVGVVVFKLNLGLSAFAAAVVLAACGAADEGAAIRKMPWGVMLMVCGVSTLIAILEASGGMDLFTAMLARLATPRSINGFIAFVTGGISIYSSTSGVVLPAFLPTVPGLVQQVGGGDPLAVALSINVGASLVDVSPLSTLGALCLACVADGNESKILFRQLLIWGMSMALVGAALCQIFAGVLARF
jgi:di/tricarboxylate transporter